MKRNNKTKICLSLFVAMMFFTTSVTVALGNEASDGQKVMNNRESILLNEGLNPVNPNFGQQSTLAACTWPVQIAGINLYPNMPVGTYELCIDVEQPAYSQGFTPVVDGALDGGYTHVVTDSTTEVICPPFFATTDDFYELLIAAPTPATGPYSISAGAYYGTGKEHSLEITQIDMAITAEVTMPFALGPADYVYLYRDYDGDAFVDNAIGYNSGAWEYWTYDGAIWTGPAAIPGAYTCSLNGAMDKMTVSFTTAYSSSRFAARCTDDAPPGRVVGDKWYMFVPTATIDAPNNYQIEVDDCSDYMEVFNSIDLHPLNIYMAADCDFVYWYIQNNGIEPIGRTWIYIDFNLNGVYDTGEYIRLRPAISTTEVLDNTDTPIAGSELAGTCTEAVEFKIPRSVVIPPDDDCFCLGFPWTYRVTTIECGAACNVQNRGYAGSIGPTDWIDSCGITGIDCTEATVKAFLDIFKLSPLPYNDMVCFDFEDVADIYNYWESIDGPSGDGSSPGGAIDTWSWSDARSHSASHSMKCTQFESYLGNQNDYLELHYPNDDEYTAITLDFWQWCEGEQMEDGEILQDFGVVQYSLDFGAWTTFSDAYWDNSSWDNVRIEIPGDTSAVDDIGIRFAWTSGPIVQNEGWYIDDVCLEGQLSPMEYHLFQTHSLEEFTVTDGLVEYCFPKEWVAEEGEYIIRVWMITEYDDCHHIDVPGTQADPFVFDVDIGDYTDLAITLNEYLGTSPFAMGDDLMVNAVVENFGTIDATDVPFTFSIKEQIVTTHFNDFVEGGYYDIDTFEPYTIGWDDADAVFQAVNFDGPESWHISDIDFVSPSHCWKAGIGNYYAAGQYDILGLNFENAGVDLTDYTEALEFDVVAKVNYRLGTGDGFSPVVIIGSSWVSLSSGVIVGTSGGWSDYSFSDHISGYFAPGETLIDVLDWVGGIFGSGLESVLRVGWKLAGEVYPTNTAAPITTGPFSGIMLDNIQINSVVSGAEVYKQVIVIPEIKAPTISEPSPDPIELDWLDGLFWPDMPTGNYVEEKTVPLDDPDPDAPINGDNIAAAAFGVFTDITCVQEQDVEHEDLTECPGDLWHIQTSGYNQYAWCGDDETGEYVADSNEALMLLDDEDDDMSFDLSGDPAVLTFEFMSWEDMEYDFDYGYLEVNPHVSDPGSHWYTLTDIPYGPTEPYFGYEKFWWQHHVLTVTPADFECFLTSTWLDVDEGAFTDDMGIRFRFVADAGVQYRGWLLDDITVSGATDVYYELNLCDDMDRFATTGICGGDWWYEDSGWGGWTCQDQIGINIPHDINNALVWSASVPQAFFAELTFEHNFDLELGYDFCYLEFSTDGGNNWISPVAFSGLGFGQYIVDMTPFVGDNVLIRWRVETDSSGYSSIYQVKDMCISGQVDTNPPVTSGTLSGTMIHGWYSSAVTFTATAVDDVSGVADTYYKIDGGSTLTYTGPITISVNGEHYIEYWSVDNVGNEEAHKTTPTFQIDTGSAPSVSITAPTPGLYLFGNQILSMSNVFIIGGFTAQATASDADSGVYKVEFQLDGTTFGEATTAPYSAYCGLKHTGAGTITAIAEDFTGNTAQDTLAVKYFKFL